MAKKPASEPVRFDLALALRICERMATGESLRSICRSPGFPSEAAVRQWAIADREGFASHYARAREAQMDALAEEILEIADDSARDVVVDENGAEKTNHEVVARARLRVDARKWLMSKIAPKRYGDKLIHAGDAENPMEMRFGDMSKDELRSFIADRAAALGIGAGGRTSAPDGGSRGSRTKPH